jgi:hypothetical protein
MINWSLHVQGCLEPSALIMQAMFVRQRRVSLHSLATEGGYVSEPQHNHARSAAGQGGPLGFATPGGFVCSAGPTFHDVRIDASCLSRAFKIVGMLMSLG